MGYGVVIGLGLYLKPNLMRLLGSGVTTAAAAALAAARCGRPAELAGGEGDAPVTVSEREGERERERERRKTRRRRRRRRRGRKRGGEGAACRRTMPSAGLAPGLIAQRE